MKITLRTLLLWRDGVLAPAEQEAFGARVAQHRNASGLELRIHAALLHPPAHDDGSIGAFVELNRVAEYIDNALPPEDLAVFERHCIESVSQLSEVAACHGMLSDLYLRRVKLPAPEPGLRQEIQQAVRSVVGHASEAGGGRVTGPSVA
ncbi:MAG: hypothetical protein EBX36_09815, partial [Planctomycetia bacterium]|nr:hypothetical protein [Planctomycetia bacterium]